MRNIKRNTKPKISSALAGVAFVIMFILAPLTATAANEQAVPVERLNDVLLETMRNADSLGYQGRFDLLTPILHEVFAFEQMARFSVGRQWEGVASEARADMIATFARLSIAEFASRFDGFSGERFEVVGVTEGRRGLFVVENDLVKSDGERIAINYVVGQFGGVWRIIDIRLGNRISELALKRSEYTSVLRSQNFAELVRLLEQKIITLARES